MNVDTPLNFVDCSAKGSAKRVGVLEGPVCIRAASIRARPVRSRLAAPLKFRISVSLYSVLVLKIVAIADRAYFIRVPLGTARLSVVLRVGGVN